MHGGKVVPAADFGCDHLRDLEAEVKYSIREDIVDVNGVEYDRVVELDYKVFNRVRRSGKAYIDFIRNNLIKQRITVFDDNGDSEVIEFAGEKERVLKDGAKNKHPVIGELTQAKNETKKLVIVNAVETAEISRYSDSSTEHSHQWLDENGWEERTSYVMTKDDTIYPVTLHITKAKNGRNILYDIYPIKMVEGAGTSATTTTTDKVTQTDPNVNKFSDRDTDSVSNRSLLLNALPNAETDLERKKIGEYQDLVAQINAEEQKLKELNQQIREELNQKKVKELRIKEKQTLNRMEILDKKILRKEAELKTVLERERKMAYLRGDQKRKNSYEEHRINQEVEQLRIAREYRAIREELHGYQDDTKVMEKEFIRIVKAFEKQNEQNRTKSGNLVNTEYKKQKNMKKMFTLMAVLAMVFCMAACGNTAAMIMRPAANPVSLRKGSPKPFLIF